MATKTKYFALGGGLDVVTSSLSIPPGKAISMSNFEPWYDEGYRRIPGFERFDGRPRPSQQAFTVLEVNTVQGLAIGQTITGATSSATGKIIGLYANPDSYKKSRIGVTKVTGIFEVDEILTVRATGATITYRPTTDIDFTSLDSGATTDIDEGVDSADDNKTMLWKPNLWPGYPQIHVFNMSYPDWYPVFDNTDSFTVRLRANVVQHGLPGSQLSKGPEQNDEVSFSITFSSPGGPLSVTNSPVFTQADLNLGFTTKEGTGTTLAHGTAYQININQLSYTQNGELGDGYRLEVSALDIVAIADVDIKILATPMTSSINLPDIEGDWLESTYTEYRDDIDPVPGSGQVNGIWRNKDVTYAFRNNAGGTADVMHIASASGWTTTGTTMAEYILFNTGLTAGGSVSEGDTLTGATSGATATIHRIVLNEATWAGAGEGYFVLTNVSGTFQAGELLESPAATTIATAYSANTALTFSPSGRWEFHSHNFFGGEGTFRTYAVNGVDECAFEIDENNVVSPIFLPGITLIGTAPNGNPYLVEEHNNYLFMVFPGGRLAHGVLGEPMVISGLLGSAEFGLGDEITGVNSVVGNVLIITTSSETRGLFGYDIADWELKFIGEKAGGRLYSTQKVDTVYALDEHGVTSVERTDVFGDFIGASVSQKVLPVIDKLQNNFNTSTIVRSSSQYRLYFDDGSCLVMYVPGDKSREAEFGFLTYPFAVNRIYNTVDESERERIWFATDDSTYEGYVFEDQVGTSFDGAEIQSFLRPAFNHIGSPAYKKRYRRVDAEIDTQSIVDLCFVADVAYGVEIPSSLGDDCVFVDSDSLAGFWDSDEWESFVWDGSSSGFLRADVGGSGTHLSFLMYNSSSIVKPFVLKGMVVHYDERRLLR